MNDRLSQIEARLNAATPYEWKQGDFETYHVYVKTPDAFSPELGRVLLRMNTHFAYENDARFIAAAPEDIAFLLRRLRSAEGLLRNVPDNTEHTSADEWNAQLLNHFAEFADE